jgi:hypothetical protein
MPLSEGFGQPLRGGILGRCGYLDFAKALSVLKVFFVPLTAASKLAPESFGPSPYFFIISAWSFKNCVASYVT